MNTLAQLKRDDVRISVAVPNLILNSKTLNDIRSDLIVALTESSALSGFEMKPEDTSLEVNRQ